MDYDNLNLAPVNDVEFLESLFEENKLSYDKITINEYDESTTTILIHPSIDRPKCSINLSNVSSDILLYGDLYLSTHELASFIPYETFTNVETLFDRVLEMDEVDFIDEWLQRRVPRFCDELPIIRYNGKTEEKYSLLYEREKSFENHDSM